MTDPTSTALVTIAPLQHALALATEAGDIRKMKEVHALASALQKGAFARRMGIDAENQAAEVVLRAERAIGGVLSDLKAENRLGDARSGSPLFETALLLAQERGSISTSGLREATGCTREQANGVLTSASFVYDRDLRAYALNPVFEQKVMLRDLGLKAQDSSNYQRVAALPDETFERMLAAIRATGKRIAKVNFYAPDRKPADVIEHEKSVAAEAPTDDAFEKFRAGVYALVGWEVGEDGTGAGTDNAFLRLPTDQLVEAADLIRMAVAAYQEARAQRAA